MNGFWTVRKFVAGAVVMASAAGGSGYLWSQTGGPVASPPASMPAIDPNAPIAVINGREINNAAFHSILMQVSGSRVFQLVLDSALVQSACRDAGIDIAGPKFEQRIKDEYSRTLDALPITSAPGEKIDRTKREQILNEVLRRQGTTAIEFRINMETVAGLRALSEGKVDVTPADIKDEYIAEYDERRKIHIIQVPDAETAAKVRDQITKDKKTPEQAATALSLQQPSTTTIPSNIKQIDDIRTAAFALPVGGLSQIITFQGQKLLVYLDSIEKSQLATVSQSSVESELKTKVMDFKQGQWMSQHLASLQNNAMVKINDPVLSSYYEAVARARQAQATQPAATATPTATPGAAPASTGAPLPGGIIPSTMPPAQAPKP